MLCAPELKIEPTLTIENLVRAPLVETIEDGVVIEPQSREPRTRIRADRRGRGADGAAANRPDARGDLQAVWRHGCESVHRDHRLAAIGRRRHPGQRRRDRNRAQHSTCSTSSTRAGGSRRTWTSWTNSVPPIVRAPGSVYTHKLDFEWDTAFHVFNRPAGGPLAAKSGSGSIPGLPGDGAAEGWRECSTASGSSSRQARGPCPSCSWCRWPRWCHDGDQACCPDWAPNIHPLVVHFPIAWWMAAVMVDLIALMLPRAAWADTTAAVLYPAGAVSAAVAYFTGRQAAATVLDTWHGASHRGAALELGAGDHDRVRADRVGAPLVDVDTSAPPSLDPERTGRRRARRAREPVSDRRTRRTARVRTRRRCSPSQQRSMNARWVIERGPRSAGTASARRTC